MIFFLFCSLANQFFLFFITWAWFFAYAMRDIVKDISTCYVVLQETINWIYRSFSLNRATSIFSGIIFDLPADCICIAARCITLDTAGVWIGSLSSAGRFPIVSKITLNFSFKTFYISTTRKQYLFGAIVNQIIRRTKYVLDKRTHDSWSLLL